MKTSNASAAWEGTVREGKGTIQLGKDGYKGEYSYASRFEQGKGTNPEELIGASHAGCFTMALTVILSRAGITPNKIETSAVVHLDKVGEGFGITKIELTTHGDVPGIDEKTFQEHAETAKKNCPISKAFDSSVEIVLMASLKS